MTWRVPITYNNNKTHLQVKQQQFHDPNNTCLDEQLLLGNALIHQFWRC